MPKSVSALLIHSLELPQFSSIKDLSVLTGLSGSLLYCLSTMQEEYYAERTIPKRAGGVRVVYVPSYTMRIIQRWILENILNKILPTRYAMAFRRGKCYGCLENARSHIGNTYGIALDLREFFPSISAKRVYGIFSSIGYAPLAATILTNLCTLNDCLPQGGVCSPALSNLACLLLDSRLGGFCEKRRIRFTRYVDDMYFSSNSQGVLRKALPIIHKIIENEGFVINEKKTRYHNPSNHRRITGITLSMDKGSQMGHTLKASKELKRKIRAELFRAVMTGDYSQQDRIRGQIAYIESVEPGYQEKIKQYLTRIVNKVTEFPELIEQYNAHMFYKNMPQAISETIEPIYDEDYWIYLNGLFLDRQEFLTKCGAADICQYRDWPPELFSPQEEPSGDDEIPF